MQTINIDRRLTHTYVGDCDSLDNWSPVGTARLTPARRVRPPEGMDDGGTYVRWATLPPRVNKDDACAALEATLSAWGCSHDHDCCGCASYQTTAIHRHGRRVVLRTRVSFNY